MGREEEPHPFHPLMGWWRPYRVPLLYLCAVLLGLAFAWQAGHRGTADLRAELDGLRGEVRELQEVHALLESLERERNLFRRRVEMISCVKGSLPEADAGAEGGGS